MEPKLYTPEELTAQTQRIVIDISNKITASGYSAIAASAASTGKLWGEIRVQANGRPFIVSLHRFTDNDRREGVHLDIGELRNSATGDDADWFVMNRRVYGVSGLVAKVIVDAIAKHIG